MLLRLSILLFCCTGTVDLSIPYDACGKMIEAGSIVAQNLRFTSVSIAYINYQLYKRNIRMPYVQWEINLIKKGKRTSLLSWRKTCFYVGKGFLMKVRIFEDF